MAENRIVLDTNCLLQIIGHQSPVHKAWTAFLNGDYTLCYSNEILMEYEEIIGRIISPTIADIVVNIIVTSPSAERFDPRFRFSLIQADPDDNKFVDCAILADAKYIVSDDSHFNVLKEIPFPKVEVIKLQQFINQLTKAES